MSRITEVILSFSSSESVKRIDSNDYIVIDYINTWLEEHHFGKFVQVNDCAGGTKAFCTPIFLAAFNHFRIDKFATFLYGLDWKHKENVQIWYKEEEREDKFIEWLTS